MTKSGSQFFVENMYQKASTRNNRLVLFLSFSSNKSQIRDKEIPWFSIYHIPSIRKDAGEKGGGKNDNRKDPKGERLTRNNAY